MIAPLHSLTKRKRVAATAQIVLLTPSQSRHFLIWRDFARRKGYRSLLYVQAEIERGSNDSVRLLGLGTNLIVSDWQAIFVLEISLESRARQHALGPRREL